MVLGPDVLTRRLLISEEHQILLRHVRSWVGAATHQAGQVLWAFSVDIAVREMLSTEGADKFVFLELASVPVNEARPFVHLMTSLFVELIGIVIVLLLKLLGKLPDNIVFEL